MYFLFSRHIIRPAALLGYAKEFLSGSCKKNFGCFHLGWEILFILEISELYDLIFPFLLKKNERKRETQTTYVFYFEHCSLAVQVSSLHSMVTKGHRQCLLSHLFRWQEKCLLHSGLKSQNASVRPSWSPELFFGDSFCASNWVRSAAMASALLKSKDTVEFSRLVWPAINATWSHISGDYTRWYKEWSRSVSRIPQILMTSS